jgi:nucleotide-binding universal stress UspA family protein
MKRILLLTDFSEAAANAISYAQQLWKSEVCEFHLMHVVNANAYTTESLFAEKASASIHASLLSGPKQQLEELQKRLNSQNTNTKHSFKSHLDHDGFLEAIAQQAGQITIDFLVLGSNGASNIKEKLFGSHALQVMRQLPYKTLVVPDSYRFQNINKVLLLLAAGDQLSAQHISHIHQFLSCFDTELHILSIDRQESLNLQPFQKFFEGKLHYHEVAEVPFEHAASTYVQTNNISLVLLTGPMSDFTARILGKNNKTKWCQLYKTPLMLIKA